MVLRKLGPFVSLQLSILKACHFGDGGCELEKDSLESKLSRLLT